MATNKGKEPALGNVPLCPVHAVHLSPAGTGKSGIQYFDCPDLDCGVWPAGLVQP